MAQTPEQRKRNMKFSRLQDAKRGKPVVSADLKTKQEYKKPPVSPFWASVLAFMLLGGLMFELISRILMQ
ncbi:hypothetical protein K3495_g3122 [Podosphaera aphanis]|nr:hypothetical protein K3495_g3122 [Podosphaera aphanis]